MQDNDYLEEGCPYSEPRQDITNPRSQQCIVKFVTPNACPIKNKVLTQQKLVGVSQGMTEKAPYSGDAEKICPHQLALSVLAGQAGATIVVPRKLLRPPADWGGMLILW